MPSKVGALRAGCLLKLASMGGGNMQNRLGSNALALALFILGQSPAWAQNDRAHELAARAKDQRAEAADNCNVSSSDECHPSHPTGCTHAATARYDAYLNFLKNQEPDRSLPPNRVLSRSDFINLEGKIPKTMTAQNHAQFAAKLANMDGIGEGNIYAVTGYLYFVDDTFDGSQRRGETCNCQLSVAGTFDFHLGIGFDPKLAGKFRAHDSRNPGRLEQTSIVAEMTPHTRDGKWTLARLKRQRGKQVKVVGQLMLDNMHLGPDANCSFSDQPNPKCWRGSAWEIHPVIQFLVCKPGVTCTANSADSDWIQIETLR